jgi:hypothetical protein
MSGLFPLAGNHELIRYLCLYAAILNDRDPPSRSSFLMPAEVVAGSNMCRVDGPLAIALEGPM